MKRRVPRWILATVITAAPVLTLTAVASPSAGASTTAAGRMAAARTALEHLLVGWHATDHQVRRAGAGPDLTQVSSTNWSGYADTGSGFSKVTGKWVEPSVTCTSTTSLAAFWVGIDGYSSSTVEQDGTLAYCSGGAAYYYTWWEMYPTNSIQIVGSSVVPGDHIVGSVVRTGTTYALKVTDATHTANSFTTSQTCAASSCVDSSAEWIAEAPCCSSGSNVYPLSDFHTWGLNGATVKEGSTSGVISSFTDDEITMVNSTGGVKAKPGALNANGNGFKVTWKAAS